MMSTTCKLLQNTINNSKIYFDNYTDYRDKVKDLYEKEAITYNEKSLLLQTLRLAYHRTVGDGVAEDDTSLDLAKYFMSMVVNENLSTFDAICKIYGTYDMQKIDSAFYLLKYTYDKFYGEKGIKMLRNIKESAIECKKGYNEVPVNFELMYNQAIQGLLTTNKITHKEYSELKGLIL